MRHVEVVLGRLGPGQRDDPLEVGADHAVLGGRRRQALEPRTARARPAWRTSSGRCASSICWRSSLISAWVSSSSPSSCWIALSCSRRKYSRWRLVHLGLDLGLDLRAELHHLELAREHRRELSQPLGHVALLEQLLLLLGLDPQRAGDHVRRAPRGRRRSRPRSGAPRAGTGRLRRWSRKSVWTCRVSASSSDEGSTMSGSSWIARGQVGLVGDELVDPHALAALHEDPQRPVGHLEHAGDRPPPRRRGRGRPGPGCSTSGSLLATITSMRSRDSASLTSSHRALLADGERRHRVRERDHLLQRQHRQDVRQGRRRRPGWSDPRVRPG